MKPTLIVVTGPTAVGKTEISLNIASHFKTVIISADSRQIYREMKIGTAVPSEEQLRKVRHYLIGTCSIHEYYNASKFEGEVIELLNTLFAEHMSVVMTGGSMLYIDAVCRGIDDLPAVDQEIRKELLRLLETGGIEALRFELKRVDPQYYRNTDLRNYKRLLHAVEISRMTGRPYSEFRKGIAKERPFRIVKVGLNTSRQKLYERINNRVDNMITDGMEEEARQLYPYANLNALNTVGYREWFSFFSGVTGRAETIAQIKSNTRRYARKQLTWLRKDPDIHWFDLDEAGRIIPWLEEII
jgi:tRNA dimethylallyltransferase